MRALALLFFALLPGAALASGFYLPWWGEALLFLAINPWVWALLALVLAVVGGLIYKAVRK
jgi:hypothetical protein